MNLNDYLLVKAFSSAEYREKFNNGDIYLNSTLYFWQLENAFQQDREGEVFSQEGKGYIIKDNGEFKKAVSKSSSTDDVLTNIRKDNSGKIILETSNFSLSIVGYLCCFYLLPKSAVSFNKNSLSITSIQERQDLTLFLNNYLHEAKNHDFYVSIYDASTFCNTFCKGMIEKGYELSFGEVIYKNIDYETKITQYQKRDINSIIFTKPTNFSYQKEFRIFLYKPNEPVKDNITESGINVERSRLGSFDYTKLIQDKISIK